MIAAAIIATALIAPQVAVLAWYWRRTRRAAAPGTSAERRRLLLEDWERERDAVEAAFARDIRTANAVGGTR